MSEATYILCLLTSLVSAALLARAAHANGVRLLWWGAAFFVGMALNNLLLLVDFLVGPGLDLSLWPNVAALASVLLLIYALIWETA